MNFFKTLRNEKGVFDLTSVMVACIISAILAATVGATVFAIVPWTQDRTAKQQLTAVAIAQQGYHQINGTYTDSATLKAEKSISESTTVCTAPQSDSTSYTIASLSKSGKIFVYSLDKPYAAEYNAATNNGVTCIDSQGKPVAVSNS